MNDIIKIVECSKDNSINITKLPINIVNYIERLNPEKQLESLTGYYTLYTILKDLGINDISINKDSKPYLLNSNLKFNISHSHNVVAVIVSESECGIDIEQVKDYNDRLANKICNDKEYSLLNSNGYNLIKLWTKKEAIIKRDNKSIVNIKDIDTTIENIESIDYKDFIISIAKEK